MSKIIHIRLSQGVIGVCWVRCSIENRNIYKIFPDSNNGINALIEWIKIGFEESKKGIYISIEILEKNKSHLITDLTANGLNVSVSNNNNCQLNKYKTQLKNKVKFINKVLSKYKTKMESERNLSYGHLPHITLSNSINILNKQLQYSKEKYEHYKTWKPM